MMDKMEQLLSFQRRALTVHGTRQQLVASNIANADTPHYKARDIDFRAALAAAGKRMEVPSPELSRTHPRHLSGRGSGEGPLAPFVGYRTEVQSAVDGNTVDMDQERAAFAESSLYYEASLNFINRQLRGLKTAITGQ
ncbi:MAG: flagellar basal body rod protein FlgB [Hydrogenophilus sp.]|nr:flagellar basal body rod protein FlgB [Hydrogenophilus sp.]